MFRNKVLQHVLKKKPSLSTLLQETLKRQWDDIENAMKKFGYFNDWSESALHQCCVYSNILHYSIDEIIYVKDDANVDVTHFILEGSVQVIQRILLEKYYSKKRNQWLYKLYKDQTAEISTANCKLKCLFMQISILEPGACFGIGEKLASYILIAQTEVKCLVIPKSLILRNKTPLNVWERIRITMDMNTPNLKQVYQEYKNGRRKIVEAKNFKKQYEIFNRIPVNTSIHDAPLILRATSILYSNKCKEAKQDPVYLIGERKMENLVNDYRPAMEGLTD